MKEENLKILVIGSGGREHTLAKICNKSEKVEKVIVAPGNGGIAKKFDTVPLDVEDNEEIPDKESENPTHNDEVYNLQ